MLTLNNTTENTNKEIVCGENSYKKFELFHFSGRFNTVLNLDDEWKVTEEERLRFPKMFGKILPKET